MLKKWLALLLAMVMLFSLAACGDDKDEDWEETKSTQTRHIKDDSKVPEKTTYQPTTTTTTAPTYLTNNIDPFAGISYTVTGISPYCKIAINNLGCSDEAQRYVSYSLDKEYYANGETAVVTATLDNEEYTLHTTQTTYVVANQPEYITSIDGLDLTFFNSELEGYITAKTAEAVGAWGLFDIHACGNSYSTYKSIDKVEQKAVYLTSVKKIKEDTDIKFYNSLNFIIAIDATMHGGSISEEACTIYVNIIAYNVVKYPDGSVKWGQKDPDSYEFVYKASTESVDYAVTTTITVQSADYNITKIQ